MGIFYFANQMYQFSYGWPIYRNIGGTLITHQMKKYLQTLLYLKGMNCFSSRINFLKIPSVKYQDISKLNDMKGLIISLSNTVLGCDSTKCKTLFIGHGTGDKKYGSNPKNLETYDYHFISGPKHLAKLSDVGVRIPKEKLIKIGNLRFDDYINHAMDRDRAMDDLGIVDRTRKNVLYAPTWGRSKGTFKKYVYFFGREISRNFNLIIRPHHHDRRYLPRIRMWAKINGLEHIYFSNPSFLLKSDTMKDFLISDILISDLSSVLYEYLITRKPIIVTKTDFQDIHHMSDEMDIVKHAVIYDGSQNILDLISKSLSQQHKTREMYGRLLTNCFYYNDGRSVERALDFLESIGCKNE